MAFDESRLAQVPVFALAGAIGLAACSSGVEIEQHRHPPLMLDKYPKPATDCRFEALTREELHIDSESPGISLFMFRVAAFGEATGAVLLLHGAGSPASALWDLEPEDYSVMRRLACAGFDTYAVDVRGYGGSTWPKALTEAGEDAPPAVRAHEVMPDVRAAIRYAVDPIQRPATRSRRVVVGLRGGRNGGGASA